MNPSSEKIPMEDRLADARGKTAVEVGQDAKQMERLPETDAATSTNLPVPDGKMRDERKVEDADAAKDAKDVGLDIAESKDRPSQSGSEAGSLSDSVAKVTATNDKPQKPGNRLGYRKPPGMPKRPLSAYNFFYQEQRALIIGDLRKSAESEPSKSNFHELGKIVSAKWKTVSTEDRKRLDELAQQDLVRYREEMKVYNAKKQKEEQAEREEYQSKGLPPPGKKRPRADTSDTLGQQQPPQQSQFGFIRSSPVNEDRDALNASVSVSSLNANSNIHRSQFDVGAGAAGRFGPGVDSQLLAALRSGAANQMNAHSAHGLSLSDQEILASNLRTRSSFPFASGGVHQQFFPPQHLMSQHGLFPSNEELHLKRMAQASVARADAGRDSTSDLLQRLAQGRASEASLRGSVQHQLDQLGSGGGHGVATPAHQYSVDGGGTGRRSPLLDILRELQQQELQSLRQQELQTLQQIRAAEASQFGGSGSLLRSMGQLPYQESRLQQSTASNADADRLAESRLFQELMLQRSYDSNNRLPGSVPQYSGLGDSQLLHSLLARQQQQEEMDRRTMMLRQSLLLNELQQNPIGDVEALMRQHLQASASGQPASIRDLLAQSQHSQTGGPSMEQYLSARAESQAQEMQDRIEATQQAMRELSQPGGGGALPPSVPQELSIPNAADGEPGSDTSTNESKEE